MKKGISIFLLLSIFLSFPAFSQNTDRQFKSFSEETGNFEVKVTDGTYVIQLYNSKIAHTSFYPDSGVVENYAFAEDMNPVDVAYEVDSSWQKYEIQTEGMRIEIEKSPFDINYYFKNKKLFSQKNGYSQTDTSKKVSLEIAEDEILYGGGERVLGMNRRGNRLQIYNRAHYGYTRHSELMNYAIPMYLSSKKYAVLFDNASHAWMDLDSQGNNTVSYEAFGGMINYFVVAGDNWYDLLEQYTALTGRQPMPPRWAFGNFSSRFGYHTQEETLNTVNKFFEDSIPLDAVVLDLYWFGPDIKGHVGNLAWDKSAFPNPGKMMDSLSNRGVKTILVTEPFILTTSNRWEEAVREDILGVDSTGQPYTYDFYFGNTGLIDVFKLRARRWFWDIYKDFTKQGVGGWWGDLGEPEVHPADLRHTIGSAEDVHNAYGHEWAGLVYEGYRKDFPDRRPFILMRAGFAGSQRYGMIPWTGDVSRSWGGLVPQPEISLQMGMQGIAYMHSDLGGFAGGDSLNTELYTRWLQYGVFQPIYRPHAQEHIPSEPVFMPDSTKDQAREAIRMRYKLLPYIYDMAFENHRTGKPLMQPLFFDEPDNRRLMTYDSAYLWGESLLVSPIKQPGVKKQQIYLPEGSHWIDFYNGKSYEGGQDVTVPVKLDHIPVFARGGSFIPMQTQPSSASEYSMDEIEMHFYFDSMVDDSEYDLYNDDGKTPEAYEEEKYEMLQFASETNGERLKLTVQPEKGNKWEKTMDHTIHYVVHNLSSKPSGIKVDGEKLSKNNWSWDKKDKMLTFGVKLSGTTKVVKIEI
ncbi:MAG: DUF5110 domain-containing protein [Bacteroidales bacterium]|nr:DUF5110 domain-containing protein [Bacteroidales bacterium]MCF8334135.1 DUF5110 domain-containing protein [Bacteroidales bacterium]